MKKHSLHLTASISTLVLTLATCLQLFLPATAHAATASYRPNCTSGNYVKYSYFSWTDNSQTDNYYGVVFYSINSNCTQVNITEAAVFYTSTPPFVSWWDHNQYANGSWGTGCPIVSTSDDYSYPHASGLQAGYYFQEYFSDNGCRWPFEHTFYANIGPLVDY